MVELTQLEIISGFSSIVQIIISFVLGFILIHKYFRYKDITLFLMGIIIILMSEWLWSYSITVILILTNRETFPVHIYVLINQTFLPLALFLWIFLLTNLMWKHKQKLILSLSAVFAAIYEIFILYAVFVDTSTYVIMEGPLDIRYRSWLLYSQIITLSVVLITVILFFRETKKSSEPGIRLKGYFFLIAIISYVIGSALDTSLPLSLILLVIVRILLASSMFELYIAFIMPKFFEKIFLSKE